MTGSLNSKKAGEDGEKMREGRMYREEEGREMERKREREREREIKERSKKGQWSFEQEEILVKREWNVPWEERVCKMVERDTNTAMEEERVSKMVLEWEWKIAVEKMEVQQGKTNIEEVVWEMLQEKTWE